MRPPKFNHSILRRINIIRHLLNHTIGHDHPLWSRLLFGTMIMIASKMIMEREIVLASVRELVHAVGAIPWLEWFIDYSSNTNKNANENSSKTTISETD